MADEIMESTITEVCGIFGVKMLKFEQREIVRFLFTRRDCMAVLPTGFGKLLPYRIYLPLIRRMKPEPEPTEVLTLETINKKEKLDVLEKIIVCCLLVSLRHGTSDVYTKFIPPANIVRGNSRIEKRFQILKDIELDGKPLDRFDELSVRLKHHTMAVQELAVLKSIKTTRKGRSSRTLQETWDKKKTSNQKNPLLGKYQTCPTQSKLDTFAKTTAILDRPTFQEQKTKSYKLDKETVNNTMNETEDRTTKLFARDAIFSNTSVSLNDNAYLNELYTTKLQDQDNPVFVDEVKASGTGLMNLGNSCWFNSVVQLYNHSKFMRNINEHFNDQISYEENLRSVLEVFDRIGKGIEVSKNHLQLALNDLHTIYGLQSSQQNDAHEFIATGIEHFMGLCEENCFIKVKESYVCTVCGMRQNKDQQVYSDFQLALPSDVIPHEGIKELLDRYFEDEEIDSYCCNDIKRWRNVRITDFLQIYLYIFFDMT
ncbi:unnamed protein product [Mytilus coruscus]|uniref:USP domain-containing protein n=1 Tax=Mytilus coruscus TaxID=42192 RepID=A0A6J8ASN8_MYTCO|nr:unnamed protein product [Mytilus coruscus]